MIFSINQTAKEYIYCRFPRASKLEKQKYIDDWTNKIRVSKKMVNDFINRAGNPSGKKVLDVGCGNGGISIAFSLSGAKVFGVEIEEELYEISKEHAKAMGVQPIFSIYDGLELPFHDNFFDYAISTSVLEHTDDPKFYLSQILRVIRPGGMLYLSFPNKLFPLETHTRLLFLTHLPQFLRPIYIRIFHRNPLEDNNLHFYGYFDLRRMLKRIQEESNGEYYWEIVKEQGTTKNLAKKIVKKILSAFGLHYKIFLPQIMVILKKTINSENMKYSSYK